MKSVQIVPIQEANYSACLKMTVREDQTKFVATNVKSIADAFIYPYLKPVGFEHDGTLIGFGLYGQDPKTQKVWIVRFMIDQSHQRKGHAKLFLNMLIDRIYSEFSVDDVWLSVVPENEKATMLYKAHGFVDTGEIEDGEKVFLRNRPR